MLGAPLAMTSALLSNQPLAVAPLAAFAWWFGPQDWPWFWLVALLRGLATTVWAMLGAGALAALPDERGTIAIVWIGMVAMSVMMARAGSETPVGDWRAR
jgi:hypothetical protein